MKIIGISLIIISVILLCIYIGIFLYASWQYENTISNSWGLAEEGWSGVYFEPIKPFYDKCVYNHRNN